MSPVRQLFWADAEFDVDTVEAERRLLP